MSLSVPLVVRLEGTNVQQGKDILASSELAIIPADDLGDAARKVVAQVKQAEPVMPWMTTRESLLTRIAIVLPHAALMAATIFFAPSAMPSAA